MNTSRAFLFAGQGAQYLGMGRDLADAFPESKVVFDQADRALGFSLSRLCFQGPYEELTKTDNCQPAILTVTIAALRALEARYPVALRGVGLVAGLSLGEYSALVAAGALNFEDAVYLVRKRGEFMEEEALQKPGKMLSLIGLDLERVKKVCAKSNTEIANLNCPGQTVISGGIDQIAEAEKLARELGVKRAVLLEVSGGFHSSLMQGASAKLARQLDKIQIQKPKISVVSNVTAKPTADPVEIKNNLIKQVSSSVLWDDSMRFIISSGVSNFVEFGPGKVLKGLMRRIDERVEVINIDKKDDILGFTAI